MCARHVRIVKHGESLTRYFVFADQLCTRGGRAAAAPGNSLATIRVTGAPHAPEVRSHSQKSTRPTCLPEREVPTELPTRATALPPVSPPGGGLAALVRDCWLFFAWRLSWSSNHLTGRVRKLPSLRVFSRGSGNHL